MAARLWRVLGVAGKDARRGAVFPPPRRRTPPAALRAARAARPFAGRTTYSTPPRPPPPRRPPPRMLDTLSRPPLSPSSPPPRRPLSSSPLFSPTWSLVSLPLVVETIFRSWPTPGPRSLHFDWAT